MNIIFKNSKIFCSKEVSLTLFNWGCLKLFEHKLLLIFCFYTRIWGRGENSNIGKTMGLWSKIWLLSKKPPKTLKIVKKDYIQ